MQISLNDLAMSTTKIIKKVDLDEFLELVATRPIIVWPHALGHLSDAQRKVFKKETLIKTLKQEMPRGVGLQRNGRYSVFFRRKNHYLRIVFEANGNIEIVSFTNPPTMPNLNRL